jgi:poly(beta-D-mannuronate) lyase
MKKIYLSGFIASLVFGCATNGSDTTVSDKVNPMTANPAKAILPPLNAHALALTTKLDVNKAPNKNFDLSQWKINLPMEDTKYGRAGKVMEISKDRLSRKPFSHPDWFYTDSKTGAMVFVAPNKAMTTKNSKNARSELRAMLAESASDKDNNFTIASTKYAKRYGAIGGQLSATLSVDWVSTSGNEEKKGAFATVVGQIHGSDNEPLKIVYRKLPGHEHGSLTWNYEINASKASGNYKHRTDIRTNIFGHYKLLSTDKDPADGIKLGEVFSYDVNVVGDIMNLTFKKNIGEVNEVVKTFSMNLAMGKYQGQKYDEGYANDYMYFKAGNYNQCNVSSSQCSNNGLSAGDFAQVSFYQLTLNQ